MWIGNVLLAFGLAGAVQQPVPAGAETMATVCTVCHGPSLIAQQRLDREGWTREVNKMIGWGARVPDAQKDALIDYLALTFTTLRPRGNTARYLPEEPVRRRPSRILKGPRTRDVGTTADLVRVACLSCHDDQLLSQRRRTRTEWASAVDRMIDWGAQVPEERTSELIDYLVRQFSR